MAEGRARTRCEHTLQVSGTQTTLDETGRGSVVTQIPDGRVPEPSAAPKPRSRSCHHSRPWALSGVTLAGALGQLPSVMH